MTKRNGYHLAYILRHIFVNNRRSAPRAANVSFLCLASEPRPQVEYVAALAALFGGIRGIIADIGGILFGRVILFVPKLVHLL